VTGTDKNGKPVYIGGPRGAIERNAVRYYFAIQSFMNSLHYPEKSRLSMSISEWYDLTTRYRKQLFDLDKKEYLRFKTKEHMNQVMPSGRPRQVCECLQVKPEVPPGTSWLPERRSFLTSA
jgi:hypothetical protein